MYNGQPVKGNKGACPTGSTWSDTQPSFLGEDQRLGVDDVGRFLKDRYTTQSGNVDWTKAGLEGLMTVYGGGALRSGLKFGLPAVMKQLRKLYTKPKKITKKTPATEAVFKAGQKPSSTFQGPLPQSAYKSLYKPAGTTTETIRKFSLPRAAGVTALGAGGVDYFAPFTEAGLERKQVRDERAAAIATQKKEDEAVIKSAEEVEAAKVQAEKDRVANLSFTERMKEEGYWDEKDATGLNRIQRLGQLMDYYGKTPKQRAATTSPADRWAEMTTENMATAASIEKALGADSVYSKINSKTGRSAIARKVKQAYGNTWIPGDVMFGGRVNDEELESITDEIYSNVVTLAESYPLLGSNQLYLLAKKQYDEDQLK
jgi:hypothetical protein